MTIRTLKFDSQEDCSHIISEAASVILEGDLVVYPTDTSYGLACDPRQETAMEKLIAAKQRDRKLGVPLLFSDVSQSEAYHEFTGLESALARLFWPGALTLVVTPRESVPEHLTGGRTSIAIRVPDHIIPRGIAKEIGAPIVGTSANRSGGVSPFSVSVAIEQLGDEVSLYIDGGDSSSDNNSTIIGVIEEEGGSASIKVYREGQLPLKRITESMSGDSDALRFWTTRVVHADM
ncbi:MAG: L-threonylcarbamoyladenylate synthase [Candidatus Thorarchaeota archaeon]